MSTINVYVDGNPITDNVIFSTATFDSQLAALPGTFEVTVKDPQKTLSFSTGSEISLVIDSHKYFGGYITQVTRKLALPVDDTTVIGNVESRVWVLRGADYNILFDKRVFWNKADPTKNAPSFSGTATDVSLVKTMCTSYLDLSSDGLDTDNAFMEEVGDPTPDDSAGAWVNPGSTWRQAMQDIVQYTGAIYYIDADKNLHYQSQETIQPDWIFSDRPQSGPPLYGFRELEYIEDGTNIVNDALVWGGAALSPTGKPVFARVQNTQSQGTHGRWQMAETQFGRLYTEDACTKRGKVIVYGSPGAALEGLSDRNRGLHYPQSNLRLAWFSGSTPTPLYPGQLATIFLYTYGTLNGETLTPLIIERPVRQIRISFVTPTVARFDAFLGIQTSDPYTLWKYMLDVIKGRDPSAGEIQVTADDSVTDPSVGSDYSGTLEESPDGSRVVFHTRTPYLSGSLRLYMNGLFQRSGIEFTETDPATGTLTMSSAPFSDDQLWVEYYVGG